MKAEEFKEFKLDVNYYRTACERGLHAALDQQVENHMKLFERIVADGKSVEEASGLVAKIYGELVVDAYRVTKGTPHESSFPMPDYGIQGLLISYGFLIAKLAIRQSAFGKN